MIKKNKNGKMKYKNNEEYNGNDLKKGKGEMKYKN